MFVVTPTWFRQIFDLHRISPQSLSWETGRSSTPYSVLDALEKYKATRVLFPPLVQKASRHMQYTKDT